MKTRQDAINAGLDHLSDLGFTIEPFFSEHGPMVVEAIAAMDENDEVTGWVDAYKTRDHHNQLPLLSGGSLARQKTGLKVLLATITGRAIGFPFFATS